MPCSRCLATTGNSFYSCRVVAAQSCERREAFDDAMIGGMAGALGSRRLASDALLPLISGLLRGVVYETVVRETPTGDPQEVAEQLNAFLRGGVQAVNGQQPN